MSGSGECHAVVRRTGIVVVGELVLLAAMQQCRRKGIGGDARRLVAHQLVFFEEQQLRVFLFRLAPPFVEGRQRGDAGGNQGVEKGKHQFVIHQHVGPARLVFELFDLSLELLVVLQEAPLAHPVLADLALHQRAANQDLARQLRRQRPVIDAPLGMQHQAMQRDALPRHHLPRAFLPVRLEDVAADQVRADLFQPFRLDAARCSGRTGARSRPARPR